MRKIVKLMPKEISLTKEGANRRIIATYKSRNKPGGSDSDGAKSKQKQADALTAAADASSAKANAAGTKDAHAKAKAAHTAAASANFKAGDPGTAKDHTDMAAKHDDKMKAATKSRGSNAMTNRDLDEAISKPDPIVWARMEELTKSTGEGGKKYSPQAASIIKAMGRLIAPFNEELDLDDLIAIGKAAGLGGNTTEMATKSVAKGGNDDEDEDDEDTGSEDEGDGFDDSQMNFSEDDADDDSDDDEDDDGSDEDGDEDDDEETPSKAKAVTKSAVDAMIAQKSKSPQNQSSDQTEALAPVNKGKGAPFGSGNPSAQALGQPSAAKGENVAKAAHRGSADDAAMSLEDITKSYRAQQEENRILREQVEKTRRDLDEERDYRALENIKKSARENFAHLNVDVEELAPVLKSLRETGDGKLHERMEAILKAADMQVKAAQEAGGLFQAVGKSSASTAGKAGTTAEQRIDRNVEAIVQKSRSEGRPINKAKAYDDYIQTPEGAAELRLHRQERSL